MRKLLLSLLLILFTAICSYGLVGGGHLGSAVCDQVQPPTEDGASAGVYTPGYDSSTKYFASKFAYTGTTTSICGVDTWMSFVGSNSHTYTLAFYLDDGSGQYSEPSTLITNGTSNSQDLSGIGGSETVVSWTFPTDPTLTNGTTYWVVIYSATTDASHYVQWHYESAGATERIERSPDAATWTNQSSSLAQKFKLYSY